MMKTIIALLFSLLVWSSAALADNPPGNVYQQAPFSANPRHFTSVPCGARLKCVDAMSDSDALAVANQCAAERLGFPAKMMTLFVRKDGVYKGCALPGTYAPSGTGLGAKAQWPICCLTPVTDDGTCQMTCHYYMTNEFNG